MKKNMTVTISELVRLALTRVTLVILNRLIIYSIGEIEPMLYVDVNLGNSGT